MKSESAQSFSFCVKALGHENAMQSHRLRITTRMEAWGWKNRLAGKKFSVITIIKDTEKSEKKSQENQQGTCES